MATQPEPVLCDVRAAGGEARKLLCLAVPGGALTARWLRWGAAGPGVAGARLRARAAGAPGSLGAPALVPAALLKHL